MPAILDRIGCFLAAALLISALGFPPETGRIDLSADIIEPDVNAARGWVPTRSQSAVFDLACSKEAPRFDCQEPGIFDSRARGNLRLVRDRLAGLSSAPRDLLTWRQADGVLTFSRVGPPLCRRLSFASITLVLENLCRRRGGSLRHSPPPTWPCIIKLGRRFAGHGVVLPGSCSNNFAAFLRRAISG